MQTAAKQDLNYTANSKAGVRKQTKKNGSKSFFFFNSLFHNPHKVTQMTVLKMEATTQLGIIVHIS